MVDLEKVRRLLSTQQTAYLILECSGESKFCSLLHIEANTCSFRSIMSKGDTHFENIFFIDKCSILFISYNFPKHLYLPGVTNTFETSASSIWYEQVYLSQQTTSLPLVFIEPSLSKAYQTKF